MSNIELEMKFKKQQADSVKRSLKFYEANKQKISDRRKELKALKKAGIVAPPKVKPEQVQQVQQIQTNKLSSGKKDIITIEDIEIALSNKTPITSKNYISHIKNIKNKFFKNDEYNYISTNSEALVKAISSFKTSKLHLISSNDIILLTSNLGKVIMSNLLFCLVCSSFGKFERLLAVASIKQVIKCFFISVCSIIFCIGLPILLWLIAFIFLFLVYTFQSKPLSSLNKMSFTNNFKFSLSASFLMI